MYIPILQSSHVSEPTNQSAADVGILQSYS